MARYGDEVLMHHEMARMDGDRADLRAAAGALDRRATGIYEIVAEMEADGCIVFDPHASPSRTAA